jgi:hypothetical protein
MLATSYVNGFGYGFGDAPSLLAVVDQVQAAARQRSHALGVVIARRGLVPAGLGGLGAPVSDFLAFDNGRASPTSFQGGTNTLNAVFCNKDNAFRPQCVLNQAGEAAKAPIRQMQQAIDRLIDQIPSNNLAGRTLQSQMPSGDGTTTSLQSFTVPSNLRSPIASGGGGGIDGIVGDTTTKFGVLALTLAGMLKAFPDAGVSAAFVSPTRNDVWAEFSSSIASYLNDVADNFPSLVNAFDARGNVPVQTQLDVSTIPFLVPLEAKRNTTAVIVGTAVMMVGLTTVAALSAAKKKPVALYEEHYKPALGRGRGRRGRSAPRGW